MKLSEVAKIMYDLQEYCNSLADCDCEVCPFEDGDCTLGTGKTPMEWGIKFSHIRRLEREGK